MTDTPIGRIPTLADLSIMEGRPTFKSKSGHKKQVRNERIYQAWLAEIGQHCLGCGTPMHSYSCQAVRASALEQITFDYIIARSPGGDSATTNQWCICRACNFAKATVEREQLRHRRRQAC